MSYTHFFILLFLHVLVAYAIAKYQQNNGYKPVNTFIGAFIGLLSLSLLVIKTIAELTQ